MSKIKQQFAEMRENTPRYVLWLLMAAAFVVVIILVLLLSGDDEHSSSAIKQDSVPPQVTIKPDMINWGDVKVGDNKSDVVKVSANMPVKIIDVRTHTDVNGLQVRDTCKQVSMIDDKIACELHINFAPTVAVPVTQVPVFIDWHKASENAEMKHESKIVLTLGAIMPVIKKKPEPVVEKKPEPVVMPEPKPAPVVEPEPEIEPEPEPEPVVATPKKKEFFDTSISPFVSKKVAEPEPQVIKIPDGCSDFAFPGYGTNGRQIGWIKPSGGAYLFHPFDDTECTDPTGTYNPDNGIITDSRGNKIGTDADHIGFAAISGGTLPKLSNPPAVRKVNRAQQSDTPEDSNGAARLGAKGGAFGTMLSETTYDTEIYLGSAGKGGSVKASKPYDRSFILRQYKPIPATIVSDVRADPEALRNNKLPVRATVDRNVYSDNGRNIIIPTGTLLLGYVDGELPGPYTSIGRMDIKWYQFILPNGVEFNFDKINAPFSGDAQGRSGIPGYGSTDYMEQFLMPMLTAIVPAAVNLINPVADAFVNQIDLDNNTVVQSGTMRSSELAKNEIITAWNQVAQKLLVDMMDNTVPPFTIAAGTRITVYSPADLIASCGDGDGKKCSLGYADTKRLEVWEHSTDKKQDDSWVGQVRSFNLSQYCTADGKVNEKKTEEIYAAGLDYRTVLFYCQSSQYEAINNAKQQVYHQSQQEKYQDTYGTKEYRTEDQTQAYNEQVLGLTYDENGYIENPFNQPSAPADEAAPSEGQLTCDGGAAPDANGCCPGEIYTDMGEQGFNCCPTGGGDCFPPLM